MSQYKFELPMSDYYNTRKNLLQSKGAPKLSDVKKNLGEVAAQVVYDQCQNSLKEDFGLTPPLKGPGEILWISPSDLLVGKLALKPPFTPKCLQALTHQGILEIGKELEDKFKMDMEVEKKKSLEMYKADLIASVEDRMKCDIKDLEIKQKIACHIELQKQQQDFELYLKQQLDTLEANIRKEYEVTITEHSASLGALWEKKLTMEVKRTIDLMTKNFVSQLDEQEAKFIEIFKKELQKQEHLRNFDAKLAKTKGLETFRQLKHNLECTNLVNMMYILCTERRKCCEQKNTIETHYKNEIETLEEKLKHKDKIIETISKEKHEAINNVSLREACLLEVIKQFQKFINFALRAAPTQAEFLLSVEKMLVFELTQNITKANVPKLEKADPIIPWTYPSSSKSSSAEELEINDFHDCFNEHYPPSLGPDVELDRDENLPAIYFKKKTYVREDFRDMLSGGVPLTPSNMLWNKDVEILVNNWREQVQEEEKEKAEERVERGSISQKDSHESLSKQVADTENQNTNRLKSIVQFNDGTSDPIPGNRSTRSSMDSRKSYTRSLLKTVPFVSEVLLETNPLSRSGSKILAAKDSLELLTDKRHRSILSSSSSQQKNIISDLRTKLIEQSESLPLSEIDKGKEIDVVSTKDSLLMRMSDLARQQISREFDKSPKDSIEVLKEQKKDKEIIEIEKLPSKLLSARNSVEILKDSLVKLREPSVMCQKKVQHTHKESIDLGQLSFTETCCDRCRKRKESLEHAGLSDFARDDGSSKSSIEGDKRSVRISQIQIFNVDEKAHSPSIVSFSTKPIYLSKDSYGKEVKHEVRPSFGKKKKPAKPKPPPRKIQILGDKEAKEGDQTNEVFTAERIHSLIQLMKDQPDLLRLFTSGSQP
ncbi:unnamed protein product [Ceutorhynchus assimilis]|uniref:Uncharacterized protein n=1 Tax=Ceutorhynchus assimilis TaxID=467358 RepID=A0A9P0DM11_9CUCU|nr:unnamed protein product [Ceutorhynchus assimilis]